MKKNLDFEKNIVKTSLKNSVNKYGEIKSSRKFKYE